MSQEPDSIDNINNVAVVIDNGSETIKAGFVGKDRPSVVVSNKGGYVYGSTKKQVNTKGGKSSLRYPISKCSVTSWDDMEAVWDHIFRNELYIDPSDSKIFLTEFGWCKNKDIRRMKEVIFETFDAPALYIDNSSVLSLYASGRTTGIVLDAGDGATKVLPIYQCKLL